MATTTHPPLPAKGVACQHECKSGRHVFVVCMGPDCRQRGAPALLQLLRTYRDEHKDRDIRVSASRSCIGHCAAAPAMVEDGRILRWVSPQRLKGELLKLGLS